MDFKIQELKAFLDSDDKIIKEQKDLIDRLLQDK